MNEKRVQKLIEPEIKEIFNLTEIKICCGTELIYFGDRYCCEADLLGKDKDGKLYAFQVKVGEISNEDDLILKLVKYKNGANYSYAILEKDKYPEYLDNLLKNSGIGLITYKVVNKELNDIKVEFKSKESEKPLYKSKTNESFNSFEYGESPNVYIFPHIKKYLGDMSLEKYIKKWGNGTEYHTKFNITPPPGSLLLFLYDGEIFGEGVVKNSGGYKDKDKEYTKTYYFDSTRVYKKKIPIKYVKDLPAYKDMGNRGFAHYPMILSCCQYLQILQKMVST